jgi:hypothetical protein
LSNSNHKFMYSCTKVMLLFGVWLNINELYVNWNDNSRDLAYDSLKPK